MTEKAVPAIKSKADERGYPLCTYKVCERRRYSHGFCTSHFKRWKKGVTEEEMDAPIRQFKMYEDYQTCRLSGCANRVKAAKLCHSHYNAKRLHDLAVAAGERGNPDWWKPLRPRRPNGSVMRMGTLEVRISTGSLIKRVADAKGIVWHHVVNEILDDWARKSRDEVKEAPDMVALVSWSQPPTYEGMDF